MIRIQVAIKTGALDFRVELQIGVTLITALLYLGTHGVHV